MSVAHCGHTSHQWKFKAFIEKLVNIQKKKSIENKQKCQLPSKKLPPLISDHLSQPAFEFLSTDYICLYRFISGIYVWMIRLSCIILMTIPSVPKRPFKFERKFIKYHSQILPTYYIEIINKHHAQTENFFLDNRAHQLTIHTRNRFPHLTATFNMSIDVFLE